MSIQIPLYRVDRLAFWRRHARLDSIDLSKVDLTRYELHPTPWAGRHWKPDTECSPEHMHMQQSEPGISLDAPAAYSIEETMDVDHENKDVKLNITSHNCSENFDEEDLQAVNVKSEPEDILALYEDHTIKEEMDIVIGPTVLQMPDNGPADRISTNKGGKPAMSIQIPLYRVDRLAFWRRHARLDSIDLSKVDLTRHVLHPTPPRAGRQWKPVSGEWHKWHAFNFILIGLVEELINLGAASSFRDRVLWIWTRYMKQFMNKEDMGTINETKRKEHMVNHKSLFVYEDKLDDSILEQTDVADKTSDDEQLNESRRQKHVRKKREKEEKKKEQDRNSIMKITKGLLLSILYIALNLDKSDIQLSHLFRFIREGRLSIANCIKFVPNELDLKSIPNWKSFMNCTREYTALTVQQTAMTLIKVLDLGKPEVPNLRKLVDFYIKELCLPTDFKNLVFSLMHQVPCDYLDVNYDFAKKILVRTPDFEGVVMSYIIVGLKMTFGLDDHYEIALSDTVEKINNEDNRLKTYKLGLYSETSDRLFSFCEWSRYLLFRKIMLCKNYLPMAQQHNLDVDDKVFIEHLGKRQKRKVMLAYEVTMDILNKIAFTDEGSVIPKSEFHATLTPFSDYIDVVLQYIQDPDVKLLISEDFTQYSIKYACTELKLLNCEDNIIKGICEDNKTVNKMIVGNLISKEFDYSMVYVRNCENRNWLKTNPPTREHITKIEEIVGDKDKNNIGYDSTLECTTAEIELSKLDSVDEEPKKIETIEEEEIGISIFDDIEEEKDKLKDLEEDFDSFQLNNVNLGPESDLGRVNNEEMIMGEVEFNPETFQRERAIKELILSACKTYKIPLPKEYSTRIATKRKNPFIADENGTLVRKKLKISDKKKAKEGEVQKELNKIMSAYYANMEKDLLEQVSGYFQSEVKDYVNLERDNAEDVRADDIPTANINDKNNMLNIQSIANNSNDIQEENDFYTTVDSSIIEVDAGVESAVYDLIPKVNPDFDEKTHDIQQLFIKYRQNLRFDKILENDDPSIDKILEKKIEECKLNDPITLCSKGFNQEEHSSDDDEELNTEFNDLLLDVRLGQSPEKLEPLIQNSEIKEFKYWRRHYRCSFMTKNQKGKEIFDLELKENFPKSFAFVIKECASILDCPAFSLYKHVQNLEQILFK